MGDLRIAAPWLLYPGIVLLVLGLTAATTLMVADPTSSLRMWWTRYVKKLDVECRFLFSPLDGRTIARRQLVIIGLLVLASPFIAPWEDPMTMTIFLVIAFVTAVVPLPNLRHKRAKRVLQIESQLDSWLLLLANALKATPSLGEAIGASARIMRPPMAQELDLLLKEVQLGTPLDEALRSLMERVGSRSVAGAMATILVGRQTGGDMPRILEESAATLREMARLEGVVRTKTAEGKSQAYVLGAIPFLLLGAIHLMDPHWLKPLANTGAGFVIILVSTSLWLGAIFAARKILAVDV